MNTVSSATIMFLIYNIIYLKKFTCKAKVYSRNEMISKIYTKVIFPLYFLPCGLLSTVYQIFRRVKIIKGVKREFFHIPVDHNCNLLIEVLEPAEDFKIKKKSLFTFFNNIYKQIIYRKFFTIFCIFVDLHKKHFFKFFKSLFYLGKKIKNKFQNFNSEAVNSFNMNKVENEEIKNGSFKNEKSENVYGDNKRSFHDNKKAGKDLDNKRIKYNVLLIHGLNGSSKSSYIKGMANTFLKRDCRIFCFNARGSGGLEPTTNIFSHVGLFSDVKIIIKHILDNYEEDLCIMGFSMGSNWLATAMGDLNFEESKSNRIKFCVGVCCPFDFLKLMDCMNKNWYLRIIQLFLTNNYKRYVQRTTVDKITLKGCKKLRDVDLKLKEITGIDFSDDYYKNSSCRLHLHNIKCPFLFLNTSDDPVIPEEVIPIEDCIKNPNISLIIIKGGHLGFFTNGKKTMAEIIIERYFDIITLN